MGGLLSELKRRHILRAGAAYAVASFALIEVVSNVAPALRLPDWTLTFIIVLLAAGFPLAMLMLWMRELGPADGANQTTKFDWALMGALVIVLGFIGYDRIAATPGAMPAPTNAAASASAAGSISIAVLPFVNLSSDPEQEFFSDGMTEEITSALAKVKTLRVVGRTSAFEFKGQNKDLRAIGQALGAGHILEGSVRKDGTQIRVTAQLIKTDDGTHVWTENYDRELKSVFVVQDEVARAIAGALHAPLGLAAGETLVAGRAMDPEIYQTYLRGKALFRARGTVGDPLTRAVGLLEKVIEREPDFAPAWALLAQVYANAPQETPSNRRGDVEELRVVADSFLTKAEGAGRRAIALDPLSSDAFAGAANAKVFRGSYVEMEDLYRQALKLDPYNPDALHGLSQQLAGLGKRQEAKVLRAQLMALEPLVPRFNRDAGRLLEADGRAEAALAVFQALPSDSLERAGNVARLYAALGRYQEAADTILGAPPGAFRPGAAEPAARLLRIAPKIAPAQELPELPSGLAFVYFHVGASDRFVESILDGLEFQLESGYRAGFGVVFQNSTASVRASTRFKALARRAGLVDYWRARGWPDLCRPVGADDFACD